MARQKDCHNTKCSHFNRINFSNCSEYGGHALLKCPKHIEWKELPTSSESDELACYGADSFELREMVQDLIANVGWPVGMGLTISDKQADTLIELVRKYDEKAA